MNVNENSRTLCRKRKRNYHHSKNKKGRFIETGLKGFLCISKLNEKESVKEAYNILNEYNDITKGTETTESVVNQTNLDEIEDELAKEVANLKENKFEKIFQLINIDVKHFFFIKTTVEKPVEFVERIVDDIYTQKQQKTRHLLRLIPVETISKASIDNIVQKLTPLLEAHFKDSKKLYSISYNHRYNSPISRETLIKEITKIVQTLGSENKVCLKEPEVSIVVEVIKAFAFLAVVPNFIKYKKFNLISLSKGPEITNSEPGGVEITEEPATQYCSENKTASDGVAAEEKTLKEDMPTLNVISTKI